MQKRLTDVSFCCAASPANPLACGKNSELVKEVSTRQSVATAAKVLYSRAAEAVHRFAGHGLPVALLFAAWSRNVADHKCMKVAWA